MRLSKIKTKEIRYVVWKYRLKRFLPHILTLCLAVIVAGGAFSAYSVYHKKHQKQLAKQSEVQREKDVNTARKKAQKEKTTLKPWYTYHSIAHAMGGLDGKDYLNSIDGFYPAYQKGYRVFEMDILLTKDNVAIGTILVCICALAAIPLAWTPASVLPAPITSICSPVICDRTDSNLPCIVISVLG